MVGLDTNVLARYILRDDEAQFARAAHVMLTLTPDAPGFITHVALAEVDWLMRTKGYSRDARLDVIRRLVHSDVIEFEDGESVVQALAAAENGADFADSLIDAAGLMFGVTEFVTFDQAAAKRLGWTLLE